MTFFADASTRRFRITTRSHRLALPAMLGFADHDSFSQQHIAELFALLGGGIKEPGWICCSE
jgi:tetraacyldisaccharide-1-P 4'-kinase